MKLHEIRSSSSAEFTYSDLEKVDFEKEMTEKEWEALCKKAYPSYYITFRSQGKGGWSTLGVDKDGPKLTPDKEEMWWVDASPINGPLGGSNGRLVGSYSMHKGKGIGKIFYKLKSVQLNEAFWKKDKQETNDLPMIHTGKAGVIPFIIDGDEVKMLFAKSSDPAYGGPDPMIAKGHVDKGESYEQAAIREGEEELGLKKSNVKSSFLAFSGELSGMDAKYPFKVYAVEVKNEKDFGEFHYETESVHWLTAAEFKTKGRRSQNHIVQEADQKIREKIKV